MEWHDCQGQIYLKFYEYLNCTQKYEHNHTFIDLKTQWT